MRYNILGLLIGSFFSSLMAQSEHSVSGTITYKSTQNVYVKFESTNNIKTGDTLYLQNEKSYVPVLIVSNQSSTSCVCKPITNIDLAVAMMVVAKSYANAEVKKEDKIILSNVESTIDSTKINIINNSNTKTLVRQKVTGSITASSYSNSSNTNAANSNRFQYLLSLNAKNIADSKFSTESYISFRHEKDKWNLVQDNIFQALKIYNLSVKYDNSKNTLLTIGRKINNNISSIGAVDGIQYERKLNNFFLGAIAGSRPNYTDYSIDFNLPQYGAYVGHSYTDSIGEMQNSFAMVEQMNSMKTDRRFAYFQHSNSLLKKLYLFCTVEFDLYRNVNGKPENTFSMSSTYLSINYKMFKRLTLSTSYDNRKNVIYYETYKSYINQIIDIEARQGLSFQVNYYTSKNLSIGFKSGYHFPNKNSNESKNLYGYISYYNIPLINVSSTLAVNYLETSYVNGKIINLNISRDFFQNKLYTDCGYQWVNYSFLGSESTMIQNIINLSVNWRFYNNHSLSVNYENTFENQDHFSRFIFQIRKRF